MSTKNDKLSIRLSDDQKEELKELADACGISCSEYVKKKVFEFTQETWVELDDIKELLIGLKHDMEVAVVVKIMTPSDFGTVVATIESMTKSIDKLTRELIKEDQLNFQKFVASGDYGPDDFYDLEWGKEEEE